MTKNKTLSEDGQKLLLRLKESELSSKALKYEFAFNQIVNLVSHIKKSLEANELTFSQAISLLEEGKEDEAVSLLEKEHSSLQGALVESESKIQSMEGKHEELQK